MAPTRSVTIEAMRREFLNAPSQAGCSNADLLEQVCGDPRKPWAGWSHLEVVGQFGRASRARTFQDAFRACCTGGVRDWDGFNLAGLQEASPELGGLCLPQRAYEQQADREWEGFEVYGEEPMEWDGEGIDVGVGSSVVAPAADVTTRPSVPTPPPLPHHAWRPAVPARDLDEDEEISAMVRDWARESFAAGRWEEGKEYLRIVRTLRVMAVDEAMIEGEHAA